MTEETKTPAPRSDVMGIDALQTMHRRAQKAEGALASARHIIDEWENILSDRGLPKHDLLVRTVKRQLDAAFARADASPVPHGMAGETLDDLLDDYFAIAYQQGAQGRNHDDISGSAQATIDKIRACFDPARRVQAALKSPVDHVVVATNKEMLSSFGAEDIREGSRMVFGSGDEEDTWEDYYEVPFHVLDRIRAALSSTDGA